MVSGKALGSGPWVAALSAFNAEGDGELRDEDAIEADVQARLSSILSEGQQAEAGPAGKYTIPTFFKQRPAPKSFAAEVSKEAQLRFLQLRHEMLLDNTELENLWFILRQYAAADDDEQRGAAGEAERVDYDRYCQISVKCAELFHEKSLVFFTPSAFLKFKRDSQGRISILPLFHYIMRKVSLQQTRILLSYNDADGCGYLRETELSAYVEQMMASLPPLANLDPSMKAQYNRIAVRKLMFFNDPHRLGKVKIADLLVSPQLAEFLELRHEVNPEAATTLASNWFSLASARRVYSMFLELDEDMDGLLSMSEFGSFSGGSMTSYFVEAVFHEHVSTWHSRRGRMPASTRKKPKPTHMDFGCFLEFLLAWENKKHPVSIAYFFRAFDRKHAGQLTNRDLYLFFRCVHKKWVDGGNYELEIDDVKDELYDMVAPKSKHVLTLQDILDSKQGDTVVNILSDLTGFWQYDSREMLMQQAEQEQEE